MKKRFLPILLFVAILALALAGGGVCWAKSPLQAASKSPIKITSDRMDAYDDQALVFFSGSVVVTQDEVVMHADELYLYYDKKSDGKNTPSVTTVSAGKIKKIEMKGHVTMEKGERTVTGDRAVFHNADQTFVVTGNAVMREGDNVITGDKITVFLKDNRGIVEGSGTEKRVTATLYPEDDTPDDTPEGDTQEENKNDKSQE